MTPLLISSSFTYLEVKCKIDSESITPQLTLWIVCHVRSRWILFGNVWIIGLVLLGDDSGLRVRF